MPIISGPVAPLGVDQFNAVANGNYYCLARTLGAASQASLGSFFDTSTYGWFFNPVPPGGPSVYMDWITLVNTASGTGGTSLLCAGQLDFNGSRYSAGGTALLPAVNPNGNYPNNSVLQIKAGNIGLTAHTAARRLVFGNRQLLGTNPAPGDTCTIKFGGNSSFVTVATSTINYSTINVPKVVIPPQGVFLLAIWLPGPQTVASSYIIEAGWIEV